MRKQLVCLQQPSHRGNMLYHDDDLDVLRRHDKDESVVSSSSTSVHPSGEPQRPFRIEGWPSGHGADQAVEDTCLRPTC
jgi:hypothetical protein